MKWFHTVKQHPYLSAFSFSAILAALIVLLVLFVCGYAPFGNNTIVDGDANIQYMDFFAYLHNVLVGNDSLEFTFNKALGGSAITMFAYYLSSPLNFLVIFFDITSLNTFFSMLFIIKVALAAGTFSIFLVYQFENQISTSNKKFLILILLSLSYALSSYTLLQDGNIIWLDGVVLLPVMLIAVSKLVREHKGTPLAITIATSLLINWYTGCINCLFAGVWFVFEIAQVCIKNDELNWKNIGKLSGRAILSVIIGVICSSILFLPTLLGVLSSSHGSLAIGGLFTPDFIGEIPSILAGLSLGAASEYGQPVLYCSCIALIGATMLFACRRLPRKQTTVFAVFATVLVLIVLWQPLVIVFSLLENVLSFWYRYSYVCIAGLVFISAYYFMLLAKREDAPKFIKVSLIFSLLIVAVQFARPAQNFKLVYTTAIVYIIISLALYLTIKRPSSKIPIIAVIAITACELAYNTSIYIRTAQVTTVSDYTGYVAANEQLISSLQQYDDGIYRISQTSSRFFVDDKTGMQANYNESLAYSYKSISTYVSLIDEVQLDVLDRLGYKKDYDIKNIVNTSIIGTDSLLGVKYILSTYPINGLRELPISQAVAYGEKTAYENPYALPLSLTYDTNSIGIDPDANPFEYQNQFYSKLLNKNIKLYQKLESEIIQTGEILQQKPQQYSVTIPSGNYAVYGNIPSFTPLTGAILNVDDKYSVAYGGNSGTLVPSVFYIPTSTDTEKASIVISGSSTGYDLGEAQFYALDLNMLAEVTKTLLENNKADELSIDHGAVKVVILKATSEESLFLSIAQDSNWTITRNGEKIEPAIIADAFYSIALEDGENIIELHYSYRPVHIGAITSLMGVIALIGLAIYERRTAAIPIR